MSPTTYVANPVIPVHSTLNEGTPIMPPTVAAVAVDTIQTLNRCTALLDGVMGVSDWQAPSEVILDGIANRLAAIDQQTRSIEARLEYLWDRAGQVL